MKWVFQTIAITIEWANIDSTFFYSTISYSAFISSFKLLPEVITSLVSVFQFGCILSFVYSSISNNTNFISDYVQTLRIVYIPKYYYSAKTSPNNILFTCNQNSRSSVTLILVLFHSLQKDSGIILLHFFSAELYHSKYPCSVFSVYFFEKGSIISYCLTCNSCSCFKIDGKSLYGNSLLKCSVKFLKIK